MQAQGPKKLMVNVGDPQKLFLEPHMEEQLLRWYDYWLKGIDNGIMREPPVRIYVRNGGGYRDEQEWPLRRAKTRNLYLAPARRARWNPQRRRALMGCAQDRRQADELHLSRSGLDLSRHRQRGARQDRASRIPRAKSSPSPARRSPEDFEVTGPVVLNLYASSSATETQFLVKILDQPPLSPELAAAIKTVDVAPPAQLVTEGWLKASHRALDPARSSPSSPYHSHAKAEPLEPGRDL